MLSVRMRFALLMVFICTAKVQAASIKKSISESALKAQLLTKTTKPAKTTVSATSPMPAIVAIEIVDAPETNNSSAPKNTSKRTVESSLGYGYHSPFGPEPPKKFMIYKYSQHDIPPLQYNQHNQGYSNNQPSIQKSIGYHIGSTTTHIPHQPSVGLKQQQAVYQPPVQHPGTTLYTTLSNQGQLGGLSNHVPYQNIGHAGMVPVIILRIYSNQLSSGNTALHTNLPQSHPYASLNNVNLQSLLQTYVQQYLQTQHAVPVQHYPMQHLMEQAYHQYYPVPDEYHSTLPTSENYPSDSHTRVIFHSNNNGHLPELPKIMHKTPGLSTYKTLLTLPTYKVAQPSYHNVDAESPDTQYAYAAGTQSLDDGYMYVYPNQADQETYYQQDTQNYQQEPQNYQQEPQNYQQEPQNYQQETQNYQPDASYEGQGNVDPPEDTSKPPFNYHAHPSGPKQRRSKKNSPTFTPTLTSKRREPRGKTT